MTAPARPIRGNGGPGPATVTIRCTCELEGFCSLCRGDADRYLDAGYTEVIKDGPAGVFSFFEAPSS